MLNKSMLFTVVLALTTMSFAQKMSQKEAAAAAKPMGDAAITCAATYSSGSGHNATQYCVTVNGNITQFSRGGAEYINVLQVGEGYGVCDLNTNAAYFDYGYTDSGNWNAASFSSTASQAVSTRLTSDGIWQIKNTITKQAASATGPGAAKVSMALKNMTGVARSVFLLRFADIDANSSDTNNDFDFTLDTAYGLMPGFSSGLGTTNNTFAFSYDAFAQNTFNGPNPCGGWTVAPQPFVGDGSVIQLYVITVPAGGTKTVISTYKPI